MARNNSDEAKFLNHLVYNYLKYKGCEDVAAIFKKDISEEGFIMNLNQVLHDHIKAVSPSAAKAFHRKIKLCKGVEVPSQEESDDFLAELEKLYEGCGLSGNTEVKQIELPNSEEPSIVNDSVIEKVAVDENREENDFGIKNVALIDENVTADENIQQNGPMNVIKESSRELVFEKILNSKGELGLSSGVLFVPKMVAEKFTATPTTPIQVQMLDEDGTEWIFTLKHRAGSMGFCKGWKKYVVGKGVAQGWKVRIEKDNDKFYIISQPPQ